MSEKPGMDLSIVTTLYYSAPYLNEFHSRISAAARKITEDYEIILVNDGSPDGTLEVAVSLQERDAHVTVIDLSRNFGQHKAIMTGLAHSKGDLVFLIDVDLEEKPELLETFHDLFRKSDADVVYGVQKTRRGGWWERASGSVFYWIFNLLSRTKIPVNPLLARMLSRRYVDNLLQYRESELEISGLLVLTGFKQIPVEVEKTRDLATTYTLGRKLGLTMRSITSFSNRPLICIAVLGIIILSMTVLYSLYILSVKIFLGEPPPGFMTLALSLWFLGGLIIFSIGVVAIYLSVIFTEVKNRPYTIIKDIYRRDAGES